MNIPHCLQQIEEEVGHLSNVQKILLGTDGSVTQLLEAVTGKEVGITTRIQEIVPAEPGVAQTLDILPGSPVNHRVVDIKNNVTGEVLMHARSFTPVEHLPDAFREDLLKADIPIGKIIKKHTIEARREILSAGMVVASEETAGIFRICRGEPILTREYRIIHGGKPLIVITEQFPYHSFPDDRRAIIETPSRLHLGLIDMNGMSGRVDGGIGIALDEPRLLLEARPARNIIVHGGDEGCRNTIRSVATSVVHQLKIHGGAEFTVRDMFRQHAGLGSGTQVALATVRALCELYHKPKTPAELAALAGRGGTSGIGAGAFELGGFLIDGGHNFGPGMEKTRFSPSGASRGVRPAGIIIRHDFPRDWKIILATPGVSSGASGSREQDIFTRYCPVPEEEVHKICHEVLMHMVPGVVEHDLSLFARAVNRIQDLGFKRVELGLQHKAIPDLLTVMRDAGAPCAGMSSFGPTVFAISDSDHTDVEVAVRDQLDLLGGGTTLITSARNRGATVRCPGC